MENQPADRVIAMAPFYVFDLDGTLADLTHRKHHIEKEPADWRGFFRDVGADAPIAPILELLRRLHASGARVEIWSGRSDECRDETEAWLVLNDVPDTIPVIMRRAGDQRPDHEMKQDFLRGCDQPDIIFDDRDSVVAMWRSLGITCLQVAPGAF